MENNPSARYADQDRDPNIILEVIHDEGPLRRKPHLAINPSLTENARNEALPAESPDLYKDPADRAPRSSKRQALGAAITKATLVSPEVDNRPHIELEQAVAVSEYFDPNEEIDYAQDTLPLPKYYPNPEDQERAYNPDLSITEALIRTGADVYTIPGIQLFGQVISADPAVPIATPSGVITGRYPGSYGFPSDGRTLWVSKENVSLVRKQATDL